MRSKQVPATTNNITLGIINFLNSKGHFAFRVNTTGIYDPMNRIFRKPMKESKGCPDVLACIQWHGSGLFVGFEIKNELTNDRMREDQKEFHKKVIGANGEAYIIHSFDEFLKLYSARFE